jgi:hypothetical protein
MVMKAQFFHCVFCGHTISRHLGEEHHLEYYCEGCGQFYEPAILLDFIANFIEEVSPCK